MKPQMFFLVLYIYYITALEGFFYVPLLSLCRPSAVWLLTFKSGAEVGILPFLFVWQTEIPIYAWLPALPAVV